MQLHRSFSKKPESERQIFLSTSSVQSPSGFEARAFGIGGTPVDMKTLKTSDEQAKVLAEHGTNLGANLWLRAASKVYEISPNLNDYVIVPVPIMFTEIPNTNGDSVSIEEMLRFDPDLGDQAFKSFKGKPLFVEHDNKVKRRAKGVILDSQLVPLKRFGNGRFFKLVFLQAWDTTKDPLLVNSILSKENNAYSLGFYYTAYDCSICGRSFGDSALNKTPCIHISPAKVTYRQPDGRLAYRMCKNIKGFECSSVKNGAFGIAISDIVMNPKDIAAY